jgi:NAD(P)-dependent dehydrogenase (short-subunit alcohol dehydrogenase family)
MGERLRGKVALVSGAASSEPGVGAGRAAAQLFAREGASVFAIDANTAMLRETHDAIVAECGTVESLVVDIRDRAMCEEAVRLCCTRFGTIDVLHNNVGVGSTGGVVAISEEEWLRVMDTNLEGARNICRAVLPVMERAGRGSIVNTSSLLSHRGLRNIHNVAYSVSKAGIEALTRVISLEYASKGIRANNLILGLIDTPAIRAAYERRRAIPGNEDAADHIWHNRSTFPPLGRQGTPWEAAQAALFLASDESSYVTGIDLRVDGGLANVLLN